MVKEAFKFGFGYAVGIMAGFAVVKTVIEAVVKKNKNEEDE